MTGSEYAPSSRGDRGGLFHGIFRCDIGPDGRPRVVRHEAGPGDLPCPTTGRPLRIATIEAGASAICPGCSVQGHGGYVSFDGDLRMAYACPECQRFVWVAGV
ncbi:MAG: hypothetical protein ABI868_02365 [Acidobacteriota bacterium]